MLKQGLQQKLLQRLSPQQIQFIKLLQVPTASLEARIEQELEDNPALLEGMEEQAAPDELDNDYEDEPNFDEAAELDSSFGEDDYDYRLRQQRDPNAETYEAPVVATDSLFDRLLEQIHLLDLAPIQEQIAENLIGNLDEDGYLRRDLFALSDDLVFKYNLNVSVEQIEAVLAQVQTLDPPGVGARDLQECLLLQLDRKPPSPLVTLAERILLDCFDSFTKKHFDKIVQRCEASLQEVKEAFELITKLNPKPGNSTAQANQTAQYIVPDFILSVEGGELDVKLNHRNAPDLRVNQQYLTLLKELEPQNNRAAMRDTVQFVRSKVEAARWFIEAIQQRQVTLLRVMMSIAERQRAFFLNDGEESALKPMILKDIAEEIGMDISTVSRVANSKYVQAPFGTYPLKYFFTEGITTETGEEVSNREVKRLVKEMIDEEDKQKPLSDQKIADKLAEAGYAIARRTVAKYREQLNLPVARLRKEL